MATPGVFTEQDQVFLERARFLAGLASGATSPNPAVGAVCVREGIIIGEGFHTRAGCPHAEPEAISRVSNPEDLKNSTLYVTLEPCTHFGKTPPCADLIIRSGIPRVVVGCGDPSEKINGKGIATLRAAGIEVVMAPDPKPFQYLIRQFAWAQHTGKAWATLKWAENQHGYIGDTENRIQITGLSAGILTHRLRAENAAILVGVGTVRTDNPALSLRLAPGHAPWRLILDPNGTLGSEYAVFRDGGKTLCLTRDAIGNEPLSSPDALLGWLYQEKGIHSVLIEGGAVVLNWFLKAGAWNEMYRFTGVTGEETLPWKNPVMAPLLPENRVLVSEQNLDVRDRVEIFVPGKNHQD